MLKSGFIVASLTLLSRVFGLAREFFIAYSFGTSAIADCVNIAFKFPNLFRRIFGEGALSAVFIPIFSKKLLVSRDEAKKFSGSIFCILLIVLSVLTLILEIAMPYLMVIIAPGFYQNSEKFLLCITLCRITTPYLIFLSITALFGGMLNSVGRFWALSFAPVIMSATVIIFTYYFQGYYTAHYSIAYSLIFAGILQIIFMVANLHKANLLFSFKIDRNDPAIPKFLNKMTPAAISSGAQQLNLFISHSISSFIPGAISILSYADRLYQLPLALIGITFATVLLPELSKLYKTKDYNKTNHLQNTSIKAALLISIPAALGLFAMSEPIISMIYERGEFIRQDTIITAKSLAAFSFGLPAFTLSKILLPIYYANLDTKTPLRITIYSIIINLILSILLMIPFGVVGIAAGVSISTWINVWWLISGVKQFGNFKVQNSTKFFVIKTFISSLIMLSYIYVVDFYLHKYFFSTELLVKLLSVFGVIASSMVVFGISAIIFRLHKAINE